MGRTLAVRQGTLVRVPLSGSFIKPSRFVKGPFCIVMVHVKTLSVRQGSLLQAYPCQGPSLLGYPFKSTFARPCRFVKGPFCKCTLVRVPVEPFRFGKGPFCKGTLDMVHVKTLSVRQGSLLQGYPCHGPCKNPFGSSRVLFASVPLSGSLFARVPFQRYLR